MCLVHEWLIFPSSGALSEQTFKPSWTDTKELKETLRYLNDYSTELLEWADTAFATIYPHDDMVLVRTRWHQQNQSRTPRHWPILDFTTHHLIIPATIFHGRQDKPHQTSINVLYCTSKWNTAIILDSMQRRQTHNLTHWSHTTHNVV